MCVLGEPKIAHRPLLNSAQESSATRRIGAGTVQRKPWHILRAIQGGSDVSLLIASTVRWGNSEGRTGWKSSREAALAASFVEARSRGSGSGEAQYGHRPLSKPSQGSSSKSRLHARTTRRNDWPQSKALQGGGGSSLLIASMVRLELTGEDKGTVGGKRHTDPFNAGSRTSCRLVGILGLAALLRVLTWGRRSISPRRLWRTARAPDGQTFRNKARRVRRRCARALRRKLGAGWSKTKRLGRKLWAIGEQTVGMAPACKKAEVHAARTKAKQIGRKGWPPKSRSAPEGKEREESEVVEDGSWKNRRKGAAGAREAIASGKGGGLRGRGGSFSGTAVRAAVVGAPEEKAEAKGRDEDGTVGGGPEQHRNRHRRALYQAGERGSKSEAKGNKGRRRPAGQPWKLGIKEGKTSHQGRGGLRGCGGTDLGTVVRAAVRGAPGEKTRTNESGAKRPLGRKSIPKNGPRATKLGSSRGPLRVRTVVALMVASGAYWLFREGVRTSLALMGAGSWGAPLPPLREGRGRPKRASDWKTGVRLGEAQNPGPYSEGGASSSVPPIDTHSALALPLRRFISATDASGKSGEWSRIGPKGGGRAQAWDPEAVWQQLRAATMREAGERYGRFTEAAAAGEEEGQMGTSLRESWDASTREEEAWWEDNSLDDEQCWSLLREAGGGTEGLALPAEHAAEWRTSEGQSGGKKSMGKQSGGQKGKATRPEESEGN